MAIKDSTTWITPIDARVIRRFADRISTICKQVESSGKISTNDSARVELVSLARSILARTGTDY